jgi:hypothetical protein
VLRIEVSTAGLCLLDLLGLLPFLCQFTVTVLVVNANGNEVIDGTLTATNSRSGAVASAPFQLRVTAGGSSSPQASVTVRFGGACPTGSASATTQPASGTPSNIASFGC